MDDASEPARKRRRPALSCVECRRRKIKCDRNYPCDHCRRIRSACTFRDSVPIPSGDELTDAGTKSSNPFDPPRSDEVTGSGIHSLPTPLSSHDTTTEGESSHSTATFIGHDSPLVSSTTDRAVQILEARVKQLEQQTSKQTPPNGKTNQIIQEKRGGVFEDVVLEVSEATAGHPPLRANILKSRVLGPSHWISTFGQFTTIRSLTNGPDWTCLSPLSATTSGNEIRALLQQCKGLVKIIKAQFVSPWSSIQDARASIPDQQLANELVQGYFRTFESTYRILHIPSFQKEYDRYWTNPAAASTSFVVTLMLVMAIGSCFYRGPDEEHRRLTTLAKRWTDAAHNWLAPTRKEQLTLSWLQATCLLILSRQVNSVGADLTWISAGSLIRMATLLGLHRDPDVFPKMTPLQAEIRRRLWSTVLEISIQSSLELGMPPMVALEDSDTRPPLNIDDAELEDSTERTPPPKPYATFTRTSTQIMLRQSLHTRYDIARLTNDFFREPSYDEVLALNAKLTRSIREYTAWTRKLAGVSGGREMRTFDRNMMQFQLRRFQLALHRPYALKARTDPRYYYSRKMALEISLAMGSPAPDDDFERLLILGGNPFREIALNAAQIVCLELVGQLEEDAADLISHSQHTQALREAIDRALNWAKERIKHEETNVKPLIFYSMTKAQIEAMEAGVPLVPAILHAAKSNAENCLESLKSRVAKLDHTAIPTDPIEQPMGVAGGEGDAFKGIDLDALIPMSFDDPVNDWLFAPWDGYFWPSVQEV